MNTTCIFGIHILAQTLVRDFRVQTFDTAEAFTDILPTEAIIVDPPSVLIEIILGPDRPAAEVDRRASTQSFPTRIIDSLSR